MQALLTMMQEKTVGLIFLAKTAMTFGGIFKFSMLPLNASRTLCIEGLSDGLV